MLSLEKVEGWKGNRAIPPPGRELDLEGKRGRGLRMGEEEAEVVVVQGSEVEGMVEAVGGAAGAGELGGAEVEAEVGHGGGVK